MSNELRSELARVKAELEESKKHEFLDMKEIQEALNHRDTYKQKAERYEKALRSVMLSQYPHEVAKEALKGVGE